jgi:hypothetical protein
VSTDRLGREKLEAMHMSISSIAEESALRLTPDVSALPTREVVATTAATAAATAANSGDNQEDAIKKGEAAAAAKKGDVGTKATVPAGPLAQLVKYIPTETVTLYVAVQAALGEVKAPNGKPISDADFTSRWIWLLVMLVATLVLTLGLSYRSQKNANSVAKFRVPAFEISAAGAAFLVWSLSLPGTPLQDITGYNGTAWSSVIILGGTVAIAAAAFILGKTVTWTKVLADS